MADAMKRKPEETTKEHARSVAAAKAAAALSAEKGGLAKAATAAKASRAEQQTKKKSVPTHIQAIMDKAEGDRSSAEKRTLATYKKYAG
jgi:hypothetical protein